ncbi:MAG: redoxin domain-containing protein [Methanomassiliicoccales archaeon]|jgi:peroxiredoxin|nr:redoxin domain-containing protein [Methanomassiliicoccales archaeon]MDD1755886.1 redoxin domain-containing protein [Methanomassiliicoccales archaeon]
MVEKDVQEGMRAPDFGLPDEDEGRFHLSEELANGPVVLLFYPVDFGVVCSLEMRTFQDLREGFERKGAKVVGISRNSITSHKHWKESMDIRIRLLSDEKGSVCEMYAGLQDSGVLKGHPRRSVFIIDRRGTIRYAWVSRAEGLSPPFDEVMMRIREMDL